MLHLQKTSIITAIGLLATLTFFALFFLPGRAEISVSATLSSATFSVDDGARLTITVNGTRSADLELPETDPANFEIIQRGRSSQINMINGQFSSAITFTCLVRGYRPGKYTIPPITIHADDTTRTTDAIPFEVTDTTQPKQGNSGTGVLPQPQASGADTEGPATFIRLVIGKTTGYVGELIPVKVKAYFRNGLRASLNSAPVLVGDGLVMPQLNEKPMQTKELVASTRYSVLTWQTAISNIKEGDHTARLELDATLLIPQRRMSTSIFGQRSPFDDDFFDSFFNGYTEKPIKVVSDDMQFTILPLPEENRPDSFTGAIGDFNLQVSATPIQAETGEPLTLTMTVSGTGNFDRVAPPAFPASANWKTYSPSTSFTPGKNDDHSDTKVFEQAIVARNNTVTEIPPLRFSYFDPQQQRYVTRESAPIPVTIFDKTAPVSRPAATGTNEIGSTPAKTIPPSQQNVRQTREPAGSISGLAPLHLQAGRTTTVIAPLYLRPLFLTGMAACGLILLVLTCIKIYRIRENAHPEDRRKKQLARMRQQLCRELDKALTENNSALFLATCRKVIQDYLGGIWNCQAAAITRADLAARLPESSRIVDIFTVAEQAAYSGVRLDQQTMHDYAAAVKDELEELS